MVVASIISQPQHFFMPKDYQGKSPEADFSFSQKEQECISLVRRCRSLEEFRQVHGQILKLGLFWNSHCAGTLVATCSLSEWGSMDYASTIFEQIDDPGSFEFNAMIRGYIKDTSPQEALLTYLEMLEMGVEPDNYTYPAVLKAITILSSAVEEGIQIHGQIVKMGIVGDVFVQNSLINMYGKCGRVGDSCAVFGQMGQKTVASWSAVIAAHANMGMWGDCLKFFGEMSREGCWRAEESTLVSVLSACTHLGALEWGRCTHAYLLRNLSGLNVAVETALLDMYIRCGSLDKGMCLFQEMGRRNIKSYSAVISGLASHGLGEEALSIFEEMIRSGFNPDDVVYVGVLSACSRTGLVEEGLRYFDRMRLEQRIQPTIQHYGCMVDLLGRAGMIKEAYELIKTMPMKPNEVMWRSLLSSCKIHQEVELGEVAAKNLFEQSTQNAGDYVTLSNLYAKAQRWQDVAKTRVKMVSMETGQVPGSSWVEVKRKVHRFVSNDMSHPQCHDIYEMLHQMEWQLKFEGYCPDTSQVLLNVDDEEKRQRLSSHSQKLALAFSLLNTSKGTHIKISRNVRMCGDCHTYTKLISMIYEREITVRDRNMFHHFIDGICSCKDYW